MRMVQLIGDSGRADKLVRWVLANWSDGPRLPAPSPGFSDLRAPLHRMADSSSKSPVYLLHTAAVMELKHLVRWYLRGETQLIRPIGAVGPGQSIGQLVYHLGSSDLGKVHEAEPGGEF